MSHQRPHHPARATLAPIAAAPDGEPAPGRRAPSEHRGGGRGAELRNEQVGALGRLVRWAAGAAAGGALLAAASPAQADPSFTLFESGQVRPLAISQNGHYLYAVNTPDNRLEVFYIKNGAFSHRLSIPVGLEPVAVAARSSSEVWVVNHLSDSVSVVELEANATRGRVVRTLLVGDEPRDIVFAGPGKGRAFITAAHRGQNVPFDPQFSTPGVGRADVWVFDANDLGSSLGGDPLTIVSLFTDTPRALAATPDGSRVYAAGFHTGNRTSSILNFLVPPSEQLEPRVNFEGIPSPDVSLLVRYGQDGHWRDVIGRVQDAKMRSTLPDKDVFVINAMAPAPHPLPGPSGFYTGVGNILFNMAVNPKNGAVYVSNTDANNMTRFEGPGVFGGSTVRGHIAESRITVLKPGQVSPRHLNKHINYSSCCAATPNAESVKSLAIPTMMEVSKNGEDLYVAALGSSKVGVYKTAQLEQNTFVPSVASQIPVTGGGPTGLALDEHNQRLFVLTRFDNAISIIHTATKTEIGHVPMYNPEPAHVVNGRRFLYDASNTSSHGDSACASCHVFADLDSLAWDLGNPDAPVTANPNPFSTTAGISQGEVVPSPPPGRDTFHPMKGPLATQSLRGMANHGPMHWRGDRTGGADEVSAQPDDGAFDEHAAFVKFNVAFQGLLGHDTQLSAAEMDAFADFILEVTYPPNPVRSLDNSLTPQQQEGRDFFMGAPSCPAGGGSTCQQCHTLDPDGNAGLVDRPGFFGSSGISVDDFFPQVMKVPHLRNLYQKVGRFGFPFFPAIAANDDTHVGDQIRGFGFLTDGSFDTIFRFHSAFIFPPGQEGLDLMASVEAFMLAFDTNLAPIVGQQITLGCGAPASVGQRIDLLIARANEEECDLVAKSAVGQEEVGFLYLGNGTFQPDRVQFPPLSDAMLRQLFVSIGKELTYTCAPPGSGMRIGIDRDLDGHYDGDERDHGTDPADAASHP